MLHTGVGGISKSDVMLAAASGAVIIGFNVRPLPEATTLADQEGVDIRTYTVIYKITDGAAGRDAGHAGARGGRGVARHGRGAPDLPRLADRRRSPAATSRRARSSAPPTCASCATERSSTTARSASLKRFKDDAREVEEGFECGIVLENFQDVKEGDVIEAYETRQVERQLE